MAIIRETQEPTEACDTHYQMYYQGLKIDPYRILQTYGIVNPAQAHAIKKLLRAGNSNKSYRADIEETIVALNRLLDMLDEDDGDANHRN